MHFPTPLLPLLLPAYASALNIVLSNDDGWAEINIREHFAALETAGYDVVLSAPAENQSGRGSLDSPPDDVGSDGCQFDSCPPDSPPTGNNASQPALNYVNSYPVTAMKYGLSDLAADFFDNGNIDLAVAGPNVGSNLGLINQFSGTVGAAVEAAKQGFPAIAFSGSSGSPTAWNTANVPNYASVYAALAVKVTEALVGDGSATPFLPPDTFLNVNFPAVSDNNCRDVEDFSFVLSRINNRTPFLSDDDVETCGQETLPTESSVVDTPGCFVSVSVGDAGDKTTAGASEQAVVLERLGGFLSCLPDDAERDASFLGSVFDRDD